MTVFRLSCYIVIVTSLYGCGGQSRSQTPEFKDAERAAFNAQEAWQRDIFKYVSTHLSGGDSASDIARAALAACQDSKFLCYLSVLKEERFFFEDSDKGRWWARQEAETTMRDLEKQAYSQAVEQVVEERQQNRESFQQFMK